MPKKNNLDIQTFQIFQDEETNSHPSEEDAPKKKKFGMPSFRKKEKLENSVDDDASDDHNAPSDAISINTGSNKDTIIKGSAIGVAIIVLVVIIDQLM